jgi:hypothetical protein
MLDVTGAKEPHPEKKQGSAALLTLASGWSFPLPLRRALTGTPVDAAAKVTALSIDFQAAVVLGEPVIPSIEPLPSIATSI